MIHVNDGFTSVTCMGIVEVPDDFICDECV